jgi:hypothetical protein
VGVLPSRLEVSLGCVEVLARTAGSMRAGLLEMGGMLEAELARCLGSRSRGVGARPLSRRSLLPICGRPAVGSGVLNLSARRIPFTRALRLGLEVERWLRKVTRSGGLGFLDVEPV